MIKTEILNADVHIASSNIFNNESKQHLHPTDLRAEHTKMHATTKR